MYSTMKRNIKFLTVSVALLLICFAFISCGGGGGGSGDEDGPAQPVVYKVSFDGNGGTGTMDPVSVEEGNDCIIPANAFIAPAVPDGAIPRTFRCWTTNKDGSGTAFLAGAVIPKVTSDITLYALWTDPAFSVSFTKKVYFSKGNLQATIDASGVPAAWKFAANQYDCLGEGGANKTIGSASGDIDLFGWSGDTAKWGISTSEDPTDFSGDFVDWGTAYCDSKNIYPSSTWRTLTGGDNGEWNYLLNERKNASNLYKYGVTVCGKANCLVIAPDSFAGGISDEYSESEWAAAEAAGLVCLPAACWRTGSTVNEIGLYGDCWASSLFVNDIYAHNIHFGYTGAFPKNQSFRSYGYSVRLVTEKN